MIHTDTPCDNCHGTAADDIWGGQQDEFMDTMRVGNGTVQSLRLSPAYVCEQQILEDFGRKYHSHCPRIILKIMEFRVWTMDLADTISYKKVKERRETPREN